MSILDDRIACPHLRERIKTTREVLPYFKDGMTLGWSGFTPVGYPKAIPKALADHVEKNGLQGKMRFNLLIGASVGTETEDRWASLDMIARRWPYQSGKNIQKGINSGRIRMQDKHLSMFAQDLLYGFYTKDFGGSLDLGIVEASAIKEDGSIILAGSVGIAGEIIHTAKHLIIELNTTIPSYEGLQEDIT